MHRPIQSPEKREKRQSPSKEEEARNTKAGLAKKYPHSQHTGNIPTYPPSYKTDITPYSLENGSNIFLSGKNVDSNVPKKTRIWN